MASQDFHNIFARFSENFTIFSDDFRIFSQDLQQEQGERYTDEDEHEAPVRSNETAGATSQNQFDGHFGTSSSNSDSRGTPSRFTSRWIAGWGSPNSPATVATRAPTSALHGTTTISTVDAAGAVSSNKDGSLSSTTTTMQSPGRAWSVGDQVCNRSKCCLSV